MELSKIKYVIEMTPKPRFANTYRPTVAVTDDVSKIDYNKLAFDITVYPISVTGPALTQNEIVALQQQAQYLREEQALQKMIDEHTAAGLILHNKLELLRKRGAEPVH